MTQFRKTKKKTYIRHNGELFITSNFWADRTITPVNLTEMKDQQVEAINSTYGWEEIGEYASIEEAYFAWVGIEMKRKEDRLSESAALKEKYEAKRAAEWAAIKDLAVIPATVDNIRIVLNHLNGSNWGGWNLPKMSIGYSAHQYDCDGIMAATITLDKPISCEDMGITNQKKFMVGGKSGHLVKYQRL